MLSLHNSQQSPKRLYGSIVESFGTKSLSSGKKLIRNNYGNPNSPRADKLFFSKLYKVYNLYILMDFYLVFSRRVCPRSSQPDGHSVKCLLMDFYHVLLRNFCPRSSGLDSHSVEWDI
jgi:hypothetical protein